VPGRRRVGHRVEWQGNRIKNSLQINYLIF
jgi:hypothetical protein